MLTATRPRPVPARDRPVIHRPESRISLPSDAGPTIALGILTAASMLGMLRVFGGHRWIAPAFLCLLAAHFGCWLMRRWHVPIAAALLIGAAVVWLVSVWTVLGPDTHYGIPGPGTWSHFLSALRQARSDVSLTAAPVPATVGFRLLVAMGAGLVALLGDTLAFRWRYVLLGAAPGFGMFVVACTSGEGRDRPLVVTAEVAGLFIYLLAQRAPGGATDQVWFAGVRSRATSWTIGAGAAVGVAGVAVTLLLTPLMHGPDGVGTFGWRSSNGEGPGGTRTVANPIVDLQTRLLNLTNTPVFKVQSPVPSYWRLTSLDDFTGDTWISSGSYKGFKTNLPGTRPLGTQVIQEHFTIQQLQSVWLPAAFNPFKVQGVRDVSYDPASDSLITSKETSNGLSYTVSSYQFLSTLSPDALRAAGPVNVGPFTQLPSSVLPSIYQLARQITAGKTTEYDKALAIQTYLLSPPFSYNLQPLTDGTGNSAIGIFLFSTHQGYCQQFAGAYAVLARAVGIPTRLAVGFATGKAKGGNLYQVTDAQAHTWPEVYFGPTYGWVPFEPTPGFSDPSAKGYAGAGTPGGTPATTTPTTTPPTATTGPTGPDRGRVQTTPTTVGARTGLPRGGSSGGSSIGWLGVLAVPALAGLWVGLNVGSRRLRWARRRRQAGVDGEAGRVLASWSDASDVMAWMGLGRHSSETFDEYARRASDRLAWLTTDERLRPAVVELAGLARQAAYAPTISPGAAAHASSLAGRLRSGLFHSASHRKRLAWLFLPRPDLRG